MFAVFSANQLGQLVTPLLDDDNKEILYHVMPNKWEKKMVEQGNNHLDGSVQSMAEVFETRIENLGKSIAPSVPSRNRKRKKKNSKKKKTLTVKGSENEDSDNKHKIKKFSSITARVDILRMSARCLWH